MAIFQRKFLTALLACLSMTTAAAPRSEAQMREAAAKALLSLERQETAARRAPGRLTTLHESEGLLVMGHDGGGFAVIARDDALPAVLGYSPTPFDPDPRNGGFCGWLRAMEQLSASLPAASSALRRITPAECGLPARVDPFVVTRWGQGYPYNMFCPDDCPTGCVSTATAQVIRHHKWPHEGQGTVYTYVPFADYEGMRYEATLDGTACRYDLMLPFYDRIATKEQREEVARLMYHLGLSMKSIYESNGTGAYSPPLCHALRHHWGYPLAVTLFADDYEPDVWNTLVYRQLSKGNPVLYGGNDKNYSGHEFVLDGYDEDGAVHVNWGWDGSDDGFFDLQTLNLYRIYVFSYYQDMVYRISPDRLKAETVEVDVTVPGTLATLLGDRLPQVTSLRVRGDLNSTDLRTLRAMAGRGAHGEGVLGELSLLDLSEARMVAGGEPYLIEDEVECRIGSDGEMPYKAFAGCHMLIDVVLPRGLRTFADGVFADCFGLDHVSLTAGEESDFAVEGPFVTDRERRALIACLPGCGNDLQYTVPEGITEIHDYAFAGRYLYEWLILPASVEKIGRMAFNRCFNLQRTYVYAVNPPDIDPSAIDDLDLALRSLYVPEESLRIYRKAPGWKKYAHLTYAIDTDGMGDGLHRESVPAAGGLYDLWGRRVGEASAPGIYLYQGRKYLRR